MRAESKPGHSVGEVIRHTLSGQQGRIVRMADILLRTESGPRPEFAYIVALPAEALIPAREAMWLASEVEAGDGQPHPHARETGPPPSPQICWICGQDVLPEDCQLNNFGKPVHKACHAADSIPLDIGN